VPSQPGADDLDHLLDREPVREHHRFGAAVAAGGEQFERAAAAGATNLYYAQAPAAAQVTHVECFHRSAKAFKGEFARKFYVRQCLNGAEHINIDQNLSILSLIAKSGGEIRHLARN
jgi:hypothetical protein